MGIPGEYPPGLYSTGIGDTVWKKLKKVLVVYDNEISSLVLQDTGDSGCGTVTVSGEELYLNSSDFSIWSSQLKVDVNFTEEATGN